MVELFLIMKRPKLSIRNARFGIQNSGLLRKVIHHKKIWYCCSSPNLILKIFCSTLPPGRFALPMILINNPIFVTNNPIHYSSRNQLALLIKIHLNKWIRVATMSSNLALAETKEQRILLISELQTHNRAVYPVTSTHIRS